MNNRVFTTAQIIFEYSVNLVKIFLNVRKSIRDKELLPNKDIYASNYHTIHLKVLLITEFKYHLQNIER